MRKLCLSASLLFCLSVLSQTSTADDQAALEALVARQQRLKNITAVFERDEYYSPPGEFSAEPIQISEETLAVLRKPRYLQGRFLFREGQLRYEEKLRIGPGDESPTSNRARVPEWEWAYHVQCWSHSRYEGGWQPISNDFHHRASAPRSGCDTRI